MITGFIGLFDTARDYPLQVTITHTLKSTITSPMPLLGSGSQRRTFPFLCVLEMSPSAATSFSQQQHTTDPQRLSNSLTLHSLSNFSNVLLITSRHVPRRKHRSSVALQLLQWKHASLRSRYLVTAFV
jgi:hypothetical protein